MLYYHLILVSIFLSACFLSLRTGFVFVIIIISSSSSRPDLSELTYVSFLMKKKHYLWIFFSIYIYIYIYIMLKCLTKNFVLKCLCLVKNNKTILLVFLVKNDRPTKNSLFVFVPFYHQQWYSIFFSTSFHSIRTGFVFNFDTD